MDSVIQTLVALVAALSVATGSPTTTGNLPDRPAIVAPVSASTGASSSASSAQMTEIKGTIQSINGNTIVVNGVEITLSPSTEIKGKLQTGVLVQVEGAKQTNGIVAAKEVKVSDNSSASDDSSKGTNDSSLSSDDKSKDHDDKSKDSDDKSKDSDDKSKDHDDKSKDSDDKSKDHDDKSKDSDDKSKDHDNKGSGSNSGDKSKDDDD